MDKSTRDEKKYRIAGEFKPILRDNHVSFHVEGQQMTK
jgi:hypothetical protein